MKMKKKLTENINKLVTRSLCWGIEKKKEKKIGGKYLPGLYSFPPPIPPPLRIHNLSTPISNIRTYTGPDTLESPPIKWEGKENWKELMCISLLPCRGSISMRCDLYFFGGKKKRKRLGLPRRA